MTMQLEPEDPSPRRMTCVRRLYVMEDDAGRTWLAAEEEPLSGTGEGGAMSHLLPGGTADVEGDDLDQVTVVVPADSGGVPTRLQAYRVSSGLLPSGAEPTAT